MLGYKHLRESEPPLAEAPDVEIADLHPLGTSGADGEGPTVALVQSGKDKRRLAVDLEWSVERFKREAYPEEVASGKSIRMVFMGRLLQDEKLLGEEGVKHDSNVHVIITNAVPGMPVSAGQDEENSPVRDQDLEDRQMAELMQAYEAYRPGAAGAAAGAGFASNANDGSPAEFVLGFFMGFMLGFIMMIWIWQPRVSRRQKSGILCGIIAGICFSLLNSDHSTNTKTSSTTAPEPSVTVSPGDSP